MYRFFSLLVFALLFQVAAVGQQLELLVGSTGHSVIRDIKKAPDGDLFATGYMYVSMDYDGQTYNSSGYDDVFLARLNASGEVKWLIQAGTSITDDRPLSMAVDRTNERIYICGIAGEGAVFGTEVVPYEEYTGFLAAYDFWGNQKWVRWLGEEGGNYAGDLSLDGEGNVYVTGEIVDTAIFGNEVFDVLHYSSGFVASLDKFGNYRWVRKVESDLSVTYLKVEVIAKDDIVLSSSFTGNLQVGSNTYNNPNETKNIFALRYDVGEEEIVWFSTVYAQSVTVMKDVGFDEEGRIGLLGYNNPTAEMMINDQPFGEVSSFFLRLDPETGNGYDLRTIGEGYFTPVVFKVDAEGQTIIGGSYSFMMVINGDSLPVLNSNELLILRMQQDGTIDWYEVGEGPMNDIPTSIVFTSDGGLWVAGYFGVSLQIDSMILEWPGINHVNLFLAHFADAGLVTSVLAPPVSGSQLLAYPNPVGQTLTIRMENNWSGVIDWRLVDIAGKTIRQGQWTKDLENWETQLDVEHLVSGTYFLVLQHQGEKSVIQLIRE